MNNMSYRDKMILLIIAVIVILAGGFFGLVRPNYTKMMQDKATFEATKVEWEGIDAKIQEIPVLKDSITTTYNEANKVAELFVNEAFDPVNQTFDDAKANYVLDQYIQPAVEENELKIVDFVPTGIATSEIDYYYYVPDVVTYSLLESADINGEYAEQVEELLKTDTMVQEMETAEVMTNNVQLSLTGKKENLMKFLAAIEEDENAILVRSVNIEDYSFGENKTQTITEQQTDEAGNVTTVTREVPAGTVGESKIDILLTFYNAMPIDEPVLGD